MARKTKMLPNVRVTASEYNMVKKVSEAKDMPIGEVIRLALREYYQNKDRLERDQKVVDDLLETVKNLPPSDLLEILEYARYRLSKSKTLPL